MEASSIEMFRCCCQILCRARSILCITISDTDGVGHSGANSMLERGDSFSPSTELRLNDDQASLALSR